MPGEALTSHGVVLNRSDQSERFIRIDVLSSEHGLLGALLRKPDPKGRGIIPPDFFSRIECNLEQPQTGGVYFAKEIHILQTRTEIARNYDAFRHASSFARTLLINLVHLESTDEVYHLAEQTFDAFAVGDRPEVAHFKALFRFARQEGFPVGAEWLARLPESERVMATQSLREPLSGDQPLKQWSEMLLSSLIEYLKNHTPIVPARGI